MHIVTETDGSDCRDDIGRVHTKIGSLLKCTTSIVKIPERIDQDKEVQSRQKRN